MIVLGIESASDLVGVAVGDDHGPRAGVWATGRRRHGEALAPALVHVLEQAGLSLPQVEVVAVDVGPGLFTGLRVGVATAKGLAQGLGIGVVGLTSLEILAWAAFQAGWPGDVLAVVDARRGEVFAARFGPGPGGDATRPPGCGPVTMPAGRWEPTALAGALAGGAAPGPDGPVLAVGDGALRYAAELSVVPGLTVAGPSLGAPRPGALVALATERLASGTAPESPGAVRPVYLRDADARINWSQRSPGAPTPR